MKRSKFAVILGMILLITVFASACGGHKDVTVDEVIDLSDIDPAEIDDVTMQGLTEEMLTTMSLEDKVGQLFIVSTDSLDYNGAQSMTDQSKDRLEKYHPGGIIFFGFNIESRDQITSFIDDMKKTENIPMFFAVDEEGGDVARIARTKGMGTTAFPPMSEIGASGDPAQARKVGETIGAEIRALGFNLDFAPVADITTNEENKEIGNRSFGNDADLVSDMVSEEVQGLQSQRVSATLKHFPGQGDSGEDTHKGAVELETTIDRLRSVEFKPFEAGIEAGADCVMVSHVSVKAVTGQEIPASLSKLIVSDILRDELGFDRIVITDAMNMKGITKFYDPDVAAIMAIQSGCDIVLMPDDFIEAYEGVLEAVKEGTLSEEQIDRAVSRILAVKIRRSVCPVPEGETVLDQ